MKLKNRPRLCTSKCSETAIAAETAMKQTDRDRISTRQLNRLRRRILRVYGTARREMQDQLTEFLSKYKALDERKRAQLDAGEITEDDYRIWLQNQVFQSDLMHAKLDGITQTCTTAQETAYKLARDEQYNIFSFGANWAFYELEQAAGVTFGLTLYNTEAVKMLLKENPRMVPNKRIKSESNRTYDARVFNRYVMQGIVQGKSVHDIAVQAVNGMADTEIHWAMNNAITALTSAQNAGALQQMRNAQALGIEVKKRWNSTHDYRTREMHRLLDQQTAELDEPFKVMGYEIQQPGDPNAAPEMVYHCRCVLSSALGKYPRQNARQIDNVPVVEDSGKVDEKGRPIMVRVKKTTPVMDYTEWYKSKGGKEKEQMWWAEERKRRKEN
nr:MAG TPA: minor capsid protein [Caudoviricetes sp.]